MSHNEAADGGAMYSYQGNTTMDSTSNVRNIAVFEGGALHTDQSSLSVKRSSFSHNSGKSDGGAWVMEKSRVKVRKVSYTNNTANRGGAMYSSDSSVLFIVTTFKKNLANNEGGTLFLSKTKLNSIGSLKVHKNIAGTGVIYILKSTTYFYDQTEFSDNSGSYLAVYSNVTLASWEQPHLSVARSQ